MFPEYPVAAENHSKSPLLLLALVSEFLKVVPDLRMHQGSESHPLSVALRTAEFPERKRWTKAHYDWLEGLKFPDPTQQIVLQGYTDDVKAGSGRLEEVEVDVERAREGWYLAPLQFTQQTLENTAYSSRVKLVKTLSQPGIRRAGLPRTDSSD